MKKLLAMIIAIAISQTLYAEYLYDEDITTDTGRLSMPISILNALMDNV